MQLRKIKSIALLYIRLVYVFSASLYTLDICDEDVKCTCMLFMTLYTSPLSTPSNIN